MIIYLLTQEMKKFKSHFQLCGSSRAISYHKRLIVLLFSSLFNGIIFFSYGQPEEIVSYYKELEKEAKNGPVTIQFLQEEFTSSKGPSNIDQIILVRHGEPALHKKGWRTRKEAMTFIKQYDSVGVYAPKHHPVMLAAGDVEIIFTSTLQRSVSTAEQLFQGSENQKAEAVFREFERKVFWFPNVKLPLSWWMTGSRLLWLMGINKRGIESFADAKQRAKEAVMLLEEETTENGKVLLVSHGLLNHYLAKYLKKNGWNSVLDGGKGYLSQKMFVRQGNP